LNKAEALKKRIEETKKRIQIEKALNSTESSPSNSPETSPNAATREQQKAEVGKKKSSYDPSELRVFVKNLRPETTEETLRSYFSRWGKVTDVYIRRADHSFNGIRCSMGYITFASYYSSSPLNVLIHIIDGMSVPIYKVQVKPNGHFVNIPPGGSHTLMVSGGIHDIPDQILIDYFSKFGNVISCVRKRDLDKPGKFQRFAFIIYKKTSSVDHAAMETNHVIKKQIVDVRRVKDSPKSGFM
jgi:RNA-binding protein Musashi